MVLFEAAAKCEGSKFRYATSQPDEALELEKLEKVNSRPKSS